MICISLALPTHEQFEQQLKLLANDGAEFIELRIDHLREPPDFERLLDANPATSLVTIRRTLDGGAWNGDEVGRQELLKQAIATGADYVDIEEDIAESIPRTGKTKRVISYHNFEETPDELDALYGRMSQCDSDVIKIVTMATTPADNVRILDMVVQADIPTVGFCMGEMGTISRVLCGKFGSPYTYAGFTPDKEIAPGQIDFSQLKNLYRYDLISRNTEVFGVIGDPIGHSLSPLLHNTAFQEVGYDGVYLPLKVPANLLQETLTAFENLNVRGYSVTIPHKLGALEFSDFPDAQSNAIGAANTLTYQDGDWHATNTDYDAIVESIQIGLGSNATADMKQSSAERSLDLSEKQVLILGAGGVARAAISATRDQNAAVTITNRTSEKAEALADEFDCRSISWKERANESPDILINCTSVGMHPHVNETPYEQEWLQPETLVFDTVYTPEETELISAARIVGCPTVTGLEMFVRQAARQFRLFTSHEPPLETMRNTISKRLFGS